MNWKLLLLVLCLVAGINWYLYERAITHPPGIQVAQVPQVLPTDRAPWSGGQGLHYRPLQRLVIKARLLSRNNIRLGSWDHISPVDLGLFGFTSQVWWNRCACSTLHSVSSVPSQRAVQSCTAP